jgi:DNA-binding response OmpR family regulator
MSATPANSLLKNVLLIDDEIGLLVILERVLRSAGYQVQCAEDGRRGLQRFQEGSWDVVIVDRAMPEMSGEDLAKVIKVSSPNVPLVMITGFLEAVRHPELFEAILAKPFRPADLLACLGKVVEKHAAALSAV